MQDGTYPTRNFATLGPLWLQPPFTGVYKRRTRLLFFRLTAPGRCQILSFNIYSKSCVFKKQSLPSFLLYLTLSLSRSYRPNLPSSFNIIIAQVLVKYRTTSNSFDTISVTLFFTINDLFKIFIVFYDNTPLFF